MSDEIKLAAEEKLRDYIFVCLCKYSANEIDQNTFLNVVKYVRDEAVAFERRKAYEECAEAVISFCSEIEIPDDMPHPKEIANEIRRRIKDESTN